MTLPIVAYGNPVLRKVASDITPDYPNLKKLLDDMWETMYSSRGVGLAAPQVNRDIRLFIIDSKQIFDNQEEDEKGTYNDEPGFRKVFINARILELSGEEWAYNEGCLSIPKIREDVYRPETVLIEYYDSAFVKHTETFTGLTARIIQHEYDHIEGKLFIDYLPQLKKRLIKKKLDDISAGKVKVDYKMLFPK